MDIAVVDSPKLAQAERTWERSLRSMLLPLAMALLIAISLFATFRAGEQRGMDHVQIGTVISEQQAIAVALSDVVYKLNLGYIGYTKVLDALRAVWEQGSSKNIDVPVLIKNGESRKILNDAIHAAASLGPLTPGYLSDRTLFTMYYEDLGYVDFIKYAFRLFGLKIEAIYYLFFAILGLSALAFLITFRSNPVALTVLFANVFAFLIEVHVSLFDLGMPTFTGFRHGSAIGLVPMWHFIFLIITRARLSVINVALAIFQLVVLILAIKTRGSAEWMVLFVIAAASFRALWPWLRNSRAARSWPDLARSLVQWPAILLLSGLYANTLFMNVTLHPAYFTDDATPYHTLWHSVYTGWVWFDRSSDPGSPATELTSPYVRDMIAKGAKNDIVSYFAALEYLRKSHFMASDPASLDAIAPEFRSAWVFQGATKWRLYDDILRRVVIGLVLHHPVAVLRLVFITGSGNVFQVAESVFKDAPDYAWLMLILLGGLAAAAAQVVTSRIPATPEIRNALLFVAAAVPFAGILNVFTIALKNGVADLILSLLIFFQIAAWGAITCTINWWRYRKQQLGSWPLPVSGAEPAP